jgi:ribosomal protein S12 methylthiotransferase
MKVCITTLGCDKNRCDSEVIASYFAARGGSIIGSDLDADIIVVNTCGFINSARKESINAIIDKFKYKKDGKKIIVCGCLVEKYRAELQKDMPEVDAFYILDELVKMPTQKLLSTPKSYAYIKIAEGCSRNCAFCTIPGIKGAFRSRPAPEITAEIRHLNVPEVILVAQDVTAYGIDTGAGGLAALLKEISRVNCVKRIRLHYCYPDMITDELITEIADNPKVCKYIDIPLQHCNARILKMMNRTGSYGQLAGLIAKLRARIPNLVIRSTLMVGFPTETDLEFGELLAFIREVKMDYVGFFAYSREAGTASYSMEQVPAKIKNAMKKQAEIVQSEILRVKNYSMVGKAVSVVCDGAADERGRYVCRTEWQSPEVDPCVIVSGVNLAAGGQYRVKITGVKKQNLTGVIV